MRKFSQTAYRSTQCWGCCSLNMHAPVCHTHVQHKCLYSAHTAPMPLFNMAKRTRQPVQASPFEMQAPPTLGAASNHSYCPPAAPQLPQGGGHPWGRHNTPSPVQGSWAAPPFGQHQGREGNSHLPPALPHSDPLRQSPHPATPAPPSTRHKATAAKVPWSPFIKGTLNSGHLSMVPTVP